MINTSCSSEFKHFAFKTAFKFPVYLILNSIILITLVCASCFWNSIIVNNSRKRILKFVSGLFYNKHIPFNRIYLLYDVFWKHGQINFMNNDFMRMMLQRVFNLLFLKQMEMFYICQNVIQYFSIYKGISLYLMVGELVNFDIYSKHFYFDFCWFSVSRIFISYFNTAFLLFLIIKFRFTTNL